MVRLIDFALHVVAVLVVPVALFQVWSIIAIGGYTSACGCTSLGNQSTRCTIHETPNRERLELQAIAIEAAKPVPFVAAAN